MYTYSGQVTLAGSVVAVTLLQAVGRCSTMPTIVGTVTGAYITTTSIGGARMIRAHRVTQTAQQDW